MAKTRPETLRRKERVKAATELRGVPEGTEGRVILANGLDWVRYWVEFDNGVAMGSISRDKLVRADEWEQYLKDRALAAERAAQAAENGDGGAETDQAAGAEAGAGGEGATVNGVVVPQLLLDRTKAALERFGVSR